MKFYFLINCFVIDLFSSSLGFHSTASVLIAFIKPIISKIIIPHNILGEMDEISLQKIGVKAYATFSFLLILIHNSCLFILEHLNFNFTIFSKIIASSVITLVIILITQLFIWQKK